MRAIPVIAAMAIGAGLAGCVTNGDKTTFGLDPDGLRCDFPVVGERVHIEIRYAANGTPSAVPEDCTVRPGTRITWRGPEGSTAAFVLAFPGGRPDAMPSGGRLASASADERQKVVIVAGDTAGDYKYEIAANGIVVDPTIIIRPR